MQILFATTNKGKLKELLAMTQHLDLEILTLNDVPGLPDVEEDQDTYEGNAIKKAQEVAIQSGLPTLADDSGLSITSLNGWPGVFSHRFAGELADDFMRMKTILLRMRNIPDEQRGAQVITVLAFCQDPKNPKGSTITVQGILDGVIGDKPQGQNGFGFDPIFFLPSGLSMAEMSSEQKNAVSSRGKAFKAVLPFLENLS